MTDTYYTQNPDDDYSTQAFFKHLFGGQSGILAGFSGKRSSPDPKAKLADVRSRYFDWPTQGREAEDWLQGESDAGREAYYCAHLLTDKERLKKYAAPVSSLWADGDGATVGPGLPQPTFVVESSPGRTQYGWRLTRPVPPEQAERLNKRLARSLMADPSGFDLTQLLRPPGTQNYKYPDAPVVHLTKLTDESYDPDDIDKALPDLPPEQDYVRRDHPNEPPVRLTGYPLEVWQGQHPVTKNSGDTDTSETLYKIGAELWDPGLRRPAIVQALRNRDEELGYRKYCDRNDGEEQYHRIVDKLEAGEALTESVEDPAADLFTTARQIAEETPAEVVWDAEPWIPSAALTQIQGKVGVGKTTLILAIIRAILNRSSFLGKPTRYTQVVYLTEQPASSFRQALDRAGLLDRDDMHVLYWHKTAGMEWPTVVEMARNHAKAVGAGMVVVDTFPRFARLKGEDENAAGATLEALAPVKEAVGDGLTVVLMHHERLSGGDVVDAGRGSSGIPGDLDQVLAVRTSSSGENVRNILNGKMRYDETPKKTTVQLVDGQYRTQDGSTGSGRCAPIWNVLPVAPDKGLTVDEIHKKLNGQMSADKIRRYLNDQDDGIDVSGGGKKNDPHRYSKPQTGGDNENALPDIAFS